MADSSFVSMESEETNAKDELVKQHMKIAEEAIAGWERAEAESAEMKEKLETLMEQKLATEDRVSHLDGALKECMKQLRHVREEQEQKIHEAVMKKTHEWEKASCTDMETKLQDTRKELFVAMEENRALSKSLKECEETIAELKDGKFSRIIELETKLRDSRNEVSKAIAENRTMSKSLLECQETMTELRNGKTHLEGENKRFKARLAALEKENMRFKSDLHILSKDLEMRINEDSVNKKIMQENRRKMANLDEECQHLRTLLNAKKKNTVNTVSMKAQGFEMSLSTDKLNRRRHSPCRSSSSLSLKTDSGIYGDADLSSEVEFESNIKEENRLFSGRFMTIQREDDEEAKSLKQMLVKKNLNQVSLEVEHLETQSCSHCSSKSETNPHTIQANVASSALNSGMRSEFRKDNSGTSLCESFHTSLVSLDMMDDFAEMEKLASLSDTPQDMEFEGEKKLHSLGSESSSSEDKVLNSLIREKSDHGQTGNEKVSDSLEELCKHLQKKLEETEAQLSSLQDKQVSSDIPIDHLEGLLSMNQGNGSKSIEVGRLALMGDKKIDAEVNNYVNGHGHGELLYRERDSGDGMNVWSMTNSISQIDQQHKSSDMGFYNNTGAALASAVRKVLEIVESFGQTDYSFPYSQWLSEGYDDDCGGDNGSPKKQRSSSLNACVESIINLCNSLVQGKVDIIDFIAEVASALDWLVGLIFAPPEKSLSRSSSQTHGGKRYGDNTEQRVYHSSDSDLTSAGNSPVQAMHNASYPEKDYNAIESRSQDVVALDHSSVSNLSFQFSESSVQEDDISKLSCEHGSLKLSLEAELKKNNRYEGEILRLKLVNDQNKRNHEITMEKLTDLYSQVNAANQKVHELTDELMESQKCSATLKAQLHESIDRKQVTENSVEELEYEKNALESELYNAKENIEALQRKVVNLEKELDQEMRCRKEAETQYSELRKLYNGEINIYGKSNFGSSSDEEGERLKKEQEIAAAAEKLSECQQTILDLGKQLKALGVSKNILDLPMLPHQKTSSDQDTSLYERKGKDDNDDLKEASLCQSGREQRQNIMVMMPLTAPRSSGVHEEGDIRKGRHGNGRQTQSLDTYNNDNYRGNLNRFPSPTHGDIIQESLQSKTGTSSDLSPMRSPSRFLSLRSKSSVNGPLDQSSFNYVENIENGEKHGSSSGFSRFFGRTRSGH